MFRTNRTQDGLILLMFLGLIERKMVMDYVFRTKVLGHRSRIISIYVFRTNRTKM